MHTAHSKLPPLNRRWSIATALSHGSRTFAPDSSHTQTLSPSKQFPQQNRLKFVDKTNKPAYQLTTNVNTNTNHSVQLAKMQTITVTHLDENTNTNNKD